MSRLFLSLLLCAVMGLTGYRAEAWDEVIDPPQELFFSPRPLAFFHEALRGLKRGERSTVRVLHFGDSHTAADLMTTEIRRRLQARFGNGGRGFVLLGRPWKSYDPKDIFVSSTGPWTTKRVLFGDDSSALDGRFGLSGIASEPGSSESVTKLAAQANLPFSTGMDRLEIFYLRQPFGGDLLVSAGAAPAQRIPTSSPRFETGVFRHRVAKDQGLVSVSSAGNGPVRLFGAVVESEETGVVYDTLGINGAFFETVLAWNEKIFAEQVALRNPDLIVIMYGTNDAGIKNLTPGAFHQAVGQAINKLRQGAPEAACLVVGPPDSRSTVRRSMPPERLDWIISVEAAVARTQGCGFVDLRALMGGPGSFGQWQRQGLATSDGVHLTGKGYAVLGELLARQMLLPVFEI
jgi:lysophospholipase L1-like esterase